MTQIAQQDRIYFDVPSIGVLDADQKQALIKKFEEKTILDCVQRVVATGDVAQCVAANFAGGTYRFGFATTTGVTEVTATKV